MYNSELQFTEQLLADWGVRTENPWEATLFYVPTFTYWYTGAAGMGSGIGAGCVRKGSHHAVLRRPFMLLVRKWGRGGPQRAVCR